MGSRWSYLPHRCLLSAEAPEIRARVKAAVERRHSYGQVLPDAELSKDAARQGAGLYRAATISQGASALSPAQLPTVPVGLQMEIWGWFNLGEIVPCHSWSFTAAGMWLQQPHV